jgi:hypothetical protein
LPEETTGQVAEHIQRTGEPEEWRAVAIPWTAQTLRIRKLQNRCKTGGGLYRSDLAEDRRRPVPNPRQIPAADDSPGFRGRTEGVIAPNWGAILGAIWVLSPARPLTRG